jgi:hypothetical protein
MNRSFLGARVRAERLREVEEAPVERRLGPASDARRAAHGLAHALHVPALLHERAPQHLLGAAG